MSKEKWKTQRDCKKIFIRNKHLTTINMSERYKHENLSYKDRTLDIVGNTLNGVMGYTRLAIEDLESGDTELTLDRLRQLERCLHERLALYTEQLVNRD